MDRGINTSYEEMGCFTKMKKINDLLKELHWNNSIEKQINAINKLKKIDDLNIFLQPIIPFDKPIWDNCALILYKKSDKELLPYIDKLLEWLQDLNWPGALIIFKRLQIFSKDLLRIQYENALKVARNKKDIVWLENLQLLYKWEIDDFINRYLYLIR